MAASNSYDEILMPNMMVLGIGAFGKGLGHEALMDGISAFIKETPQGSLLSYAMWGHNEKCAVWRIPHLTMLALLSQTSNFQDCQKQISVLWKPLSLWHFLVAA